MVIGLLIALQINTWSQENQNRKQEQILNHPDFEDYMSLFISNTTYTNDQSYGVKNKIKEII
nr:hypothetical protein [uncultured Psychroserpens sp.]